MTLRVFKAN